jgi:hypothetical protein
MAQDVAKVSSRPCGAGDIGKLTDSNQDCRAGDVTSDYWL